MKLKVIYNTIVSTVILIIASIHTVNAHGVAGNILTIGGTSDVLFASERMGYASASGTFSALVATISSIEPQTDGTILIGSRHNFKTNDNGYFNTVDSSTLLPVVNKPGVYLITTTFVVKESGGSLSGYTDQSFTGAGIINFNNNTANVRYEGTLLRNDSFIANRNISVFKRLESSYRY